MSFQRRGCGIHVVSAEPERAAGPESPVMGMLRKHRRTKGHTHGPWRRADDQQKLTGNIRFRATPPRDTWLSGHCVLTTRMRQRGAGLGRRGGSPVTGNVAE